MTLAVPVPQYIAGCPVLAAIAVPSRPGELPCEYVVICQQDHAPPGGGPYVTWRAGTRDGRQWAAEHPCHGLTWPQAVASFTSRASLPATAGPPAPLHRPARRPRGPGGEAGQ